ncbi:hypothetical protein LINPERPRIM_LOCUS31403 [Linum perenne]
MDCYSGYKQIYIVDEDITRQLSVV